jgi:hypothetical protein
MKRLAAFVLLLIYLVTSTGASLHMHYCMGEIDNSSIWGGKENECGICGMETPYGMDGCCKDEIHWIKIEDDQKATSTVFGITKLEASIICFSEPLDIVPPLDWIPPTSQNKAQLRNVPVLAYLLNCVFRI